MKSANLQALPKAGRWIQHCLGPSRSLVLVGVLVPSESVTKTLPLQSQWEKLQWLWLPTPLSESGLCQPLRQRGGRHVRCKEARSLHCTQKRYCGGSLVVQWLGICRPTQGTQVRSLVWELKSPMPQSNSAHVPQLLSLRSRACEPH